MSFEDQLNATWCIALSIASLLEGGHIEFRMSLALPDTYGVLGMNCPLIMVYSSRGQRSAFHLNSSKGHLLTCTGPIKVLIGCKLRQERLCIGWHRLRYLYVSQCTICTKHKASPPAQPMLPRDIPDGPWQDITADHMTFKSHGYLIICDTFSKYPFSTR